MKRLLNTFVVLALVLAPIVSWGTTLPAGKGVIVDDGTTKGAAATLRLPNSTISSLLNGTAVIDLSVLGGGDMSAATWAPDGYIPVLKGGTGATTASGARTALGLAIGSGGQVQAYSAMLDKFAAFTDPAADKLLYWKDSDNSIGVVSLGAGLDFTGGTLSNTATAGDATTSTKGIASFAASDFDVSSGAVSLDYTNGQKATGSVPGFLTAADWTTFNGKLGTALTDGKIWAGNVSNVATAVTPSGDVTMSNAGAFTIGSKKVVAGMIADSIARGATTLLDLSLAVPQSGLDYGLVLPTFANVTPATEAAYITHAGSSIKFWDTTNHGWATLSTSGSGAPSDSPYLIIAGANDVNLSAERRLAIGAGISGTDGSVNGTYTIATDLSTLVTNQTLWDGANASRTLTINLSGTDPVFTFTSGTVNLSTGSLQVGGKAVALLDSPTFITPTLGAATATTINKVAITAPATLSTLTIADGKTLTASNTLTFTGTDSSSVAFGTGGTVAYTGGNLSQFAATTSAQLYGVLNDETGSASGSPVAVFSVNPTLSGATFADATNIVFNATTGTKLGTATTQKLAFYNSTPIAQPTGSVITALTNLGLVGTPTIAVTELSTFTSANLYGRLTDETGSASGSPLAVFSVNPTLNGLTLADSTNIAVNTTTGSQIGTGATQKLGFFGATPVVQQTGNVLTALSNLGLVTSGSLTQANITNLVASGKTFTASNTITLAAGADGQTFTFPAATGSIPALNSTNTWTSTNTFTTLSAGAGGFAVDADGDTTMKSVTLIKTSGTAGQLDLWNDYLTQQYGISLKGPTGTMSAAYTWQYPNAAPTTGQVNAYGTPTTWVVPALSASYANQISFAGAMTSGGIPYASSANTLSSTAALTQYGVLLGGGAGGAPTTVSGLGTSGYALVSNGPGVAPTWQAVAPSTTVPANLGGTGIANNAASTITISGNYGTTFTVTNTTALTLPTSGTVATITAPIALASQAAGDTFYATSGTAIARLAKGTAYQFLQMNSGATAPEWTSTLGATGTRLTAGFFTDFTVTNAIAGSVTGSAATLTGTLANIASSTSANLATTLSDESGTGYVAFTDGADTTIKMQGTFAAPITTNPLTLTAAQCKNNVLYYGATGTVNLPAATAGMNLVIYNTGAFTVTIDPNGTDVVVRDGTAQSGGVSFTLSSGAGNYVTLVADAANHWTTVGYKGTLAQGS